MTEAEFVYHCIFFIFSFGIVYPPTEFVSIGLTINHIFASLLGSEEIEFVQYHLRRTCLTQIVHGFLPLVYIVIYYLKFGVLLEYDAIESPLTFLVWNSIVLFAILAPAVATGLVYYSHKKDWENHPIVNNLRKYCNADKQWERIAADVNAEFRRNDKITMQTSPIHFVAATQNWIIKAAHYNVHFAHQSDTALIAVQSDSHDINETSTDAIQFVNIRVKPMRTGVSEFMIRINALEFKSLQDRMMRPITILDGVTFSKTVIDRFVEVFKQQIEMNPRYKTSEVTDSCFACMQAEPNIKLQKQCLDADENGQPHNNAETRCGNCYCRPMWCVECMAKWFASRQNQYDKEVWLQQKCTCPMCRATFCILDVCYIDLELEPTT